MSDSAGEAGGSDGLDPDRIEADLCAGRGLSSTERACRSLRNHAEAGYPAVALTAVGGEDGEEDGAEVSRATRPELHGSEVPGRIAPRPDVVTVAAVEQSDARIAANSN